MYRLTRNSCDSRLRLLAALSLPAVFALSSWAFDVQVPVNPVTQANGTYSSIRWDWEKSVSVVSAQDFEGEFPGEGWTQIITNKVLDESGNEVDPSLGVLPGTWVDYRATGAEPDDDIYPFGGNSCAVLLLSESFQDEWLIAHPNGANYLDFQNFLHPIARNYGEDPMFPDHYYVKISYDNGETWKVLWDGRYDTWYEEGWHQMSLYLGDTDENTLVAWNAVSSKEEGLYVMWMIDDVVFSRSDAASTRASESLPTCFRIYLDGDVLDEVKTRVFSEGYDKEAGEHVYKVVPFDQVSGKEFEGVEVPFTIEEIYFNPPSNVKATTEYDEKNNSYSISLTWDDPEGDRKPDSYTVFANNALFGAELTEHNAGQSGLYKGVYRFEVLAVYSFPDGESERVGVDIAAGTVFPPSNLNLDGNTLKWDEPFESEGGIVYRVFRGNNTLAEDIDAQTFTDSEAPQGVYVYSVKAVYPDGTVSLPASINCANGEYVASTVPFEENFDNGLLPDNWHVERPRANMKDMYFWRFDNWFELPMDSETDCFQNGFASISSEIAGFNRLECSLWTPPITFPEESVIEFSHYFYSPNKLSATTSYTLEYSLDNGENWAIIEDLGVYDQSEAYEISIATPNELAGKTALIRWHYLDRLGGYAGVDNVRISDSNSVDGIEKDSDVRLDVNSDRINVKAAKGVASVIVTNMQGMTVKNMESGGEDNVTVSTEGLNGIYVITIETTGGKRVNRKIAL